MSRFKRIKNFYCFFKDSNKSETLFLFPVNALAVENTRLLAQFGSSAFVPSVVNAETLITGKWHPSIITE